MLIWMRIWNCMKILLKEQMGTFILVWLDLCALASLRSSKILWTFLLFQILVTSLKESVQKMSFLKVALGERLWQLSLSLFQMRLFQLLLMIMLNLMLGLLIAWATLWTTRLAIWRAIFLEWWKLRGLTRQFRLKRLQKLALEKLFKSILLLEFWLQQMAVFLE